MAKIIENRRTIGANGAACYLPEAYSLQAGL